MNLSNIFNTEGLPVGRTLFLAWITATLLHIQWNVDIQFREVNYVEFVLEAGILFGYFSALKYGGMLILITFAKFLEKNSKSQSRFRNSRLFRSSFFINAIHFLVQRSVLIIEIAAMFLAFLLYSDTIVKILAPIGLIIILIDFPIKGKNTN